MGHSLFSRRQKLIQKRAEVFKSMENLSYVPDNDRDGDANNNQLSCRVDNDRHATADNNNPLRVARTDNNRAATQTAVKNRPVRAKSMEPSQFRAAMCDINWTDNLNHEPEYCSSQPRVAATDRATARTDNNSLSSRCFANPLSVHASNSCSNVRPVEATCKSDQVCSIKICSVSHFS